MSQESWNRLIVFLAGVAVTLVIVLAFYSFHSDGTTREPSVPVEDVDPEVLTRLQMLLIADEMPHPFAKHIWVLATKMVIDGYVDHNGTPLKLDVPTLNFITTGIRGLRPPDNGLFPVDWKLVREPFITDEIPPTWLTCRSAGGFSYELYDRITSEWQKMLNVLPRTDYVAGYRMMALASVLHEKQTNNEHEFKTELESQKSRDPEFVIEHTVNHDPYMFSLKFSYTSADFQIECNVNEGYDGTMVVMQINCLNPYAVAQ